MESQLDDDKYIDAQLLSLKVPVSDLAYCNNSQTFERVDGEIEINGLIYKLVKRRLYQDSIEYLCIQNSAVMYLKSAKDEFFKLVNDLQASSQSKKADPHKNLTKSFSSDNYTIGDLFLLNNSSVAVSIKPSHFSDDISSLFSVIDEQPPDTLS
jgi:hypothetical protein